MTQLKTTLELHPGGPEDVLAAEVVVPGGGVVEECGVPVLLKPKICDSQKITV